MNTTEYFKRTIQAYLEERAMEDELFAAKYDNPDKNIDDCVTYILNWVQKSGCNGFCDDEIYGQAIHYYEEKDIEVGKPLNCQVSVNHHIELTEEEKAQARQEAIRQYQQEQMNKMRNRDTAKRTSQRTETEVHQPSLFDTLCLSVEARTDHLHGLRTRLDYGRGCGQMCLPEV